MFFLFTLIYSYFLSQNFKQLMFIILPNETMIFHENCQAIFTTSMTIKNKLPQLKSLISHFSSP